MLGLTVNGVAQTIQTNVAGTTAAQFRQRGNEYPIVVRLREEDREQINDIGDVLVNTPNGQVVPARNLLAVDRETGPSRSIARTWSGSSASTPSLKWRSATRSINVQSAPGPDSRAAGLLGRLRV